MWIALSIVICVVVALAALVGYQYVRPPRGTFVKRHEMTPFEAETLAEQKSMTGYMSGGGPGGSWRSRAGSSWKDKTSGK